MGNVTGVKERLLDPAATCFCDRPCPHSVPRRDCDAGVFGQRTAQAMEMRCCLCGGVVK